MKDRFDEELSHFKEWLCDLTPTGLHEAEREIVEQIETIKKQEGYY